MFGIVQTMLHVSDSSLGVGLVYFEVLWIGDAQHRLSFSFVSGSNQYVDMVFVVEGSSSMSNADFENVKRWMLTLVQNFDLSTGMRVDFPFVLTKR